MGLFNIAEHYDVVYSSTAPATVSGTADGTIWHCSTCNRNYRYDEVRHKWYSVSDTVLMYNRSGPTGNVYLCTGETNDDQIGQELHMDFTIMAIRAIAAGGDDLTYRIYSDSSEVFNFSTSSLSYTNDSVYADVNKDTLLKVYAEKAGAQSVDSPVIALNIAWRRDA